MRISDWSSDVCSSDLPRVLEHRRRDKGDDIVEPAARRKVRRLDSRRHRLGFGRAFALGGMSEASRAYRQEHGEKSASPTNPLLLIYNKRDIKREIFNLPS